MAGSATGINTGSSVVYRDYRHASKAFISNGYEFIPRYKFLFHVYFNINVGQIPQLATVFGGGDQARVGLMVKTIQLPQFNVSVDTLNQYNRKRLVQSKIEYQPIQIVFHDDQADLIRNLWYNYYSYYYKDPSQNYINVPSQNGAAGASATQMNGSLYNNRNTYAPNIEYTDWGYIGESYAGSQSGSMVKPPFFNDVQIYGFSQKKFASYVLINPLIETWYHDMYDYAAGDGSMVNTVTMRYETVKYYTGDIGGSRPSIAVPGFADPAYYDTASSPIAMPGSTATVQQNGSTVYTEQGSVTDLQALNTINTNGAVQQPTVNFNVQNPASGAQIQVPNPSTVLQQALNAAQTPNGAGGTIFPTPTR